MPVAEESLYYRPKPKSEKIGIINSIKSVLEKDGRVTAAWLFGSFARGGENLASDVDIIMELNTKKRYSMFDVLDLSFLLEKKINRKVDLVEKGCLREFALETASKDLIKIYG